MGIIRWKVESNHQPGHCLHCKLVDSLKWYRIPLFLMWTGHRYQNLGEILSSTLYISIYTHLLGLNFIKSKCVHDIPEKRLFTQKCRYLFDSKLEWISAPVVAVTISKMELKFTLFSWFQLQSFQRVFYKRSTLTCGYLIAFF